PLFLREYDGFQQWVTEPFPEISPGKRTLARDQILKILRHPLEDEIPIAFRITVHVDHLDNVGVLEVLKHPDLALKALTAALILRHKPDAFTGCERHGVGVERLQDRRLRALSDRRAQGVAVA